MSTWLIAAIAVTIGLSALVPAAKRRTPRRRRRSVYLPFDIEIALGTLANDGVSTSALQTLTQDFDIYGVRASVTITGATQGEGPIETGWCQSELTGTQIVANRDASPTSQWDVLANEQSKRKVRVFGSSSGNPSDSLNDGKMIWKKMFLRIPSGKALCDLWIINRSGAALTTGQVIHMQGHVVGAWK